MEELLKKRTVARRFFTIAEKDVLVAFGDKEIELPALIKYFEDKAEDMFDVDQKIKELLFQSDADDEKIFSDLESAEQYKRRYLKVRAKLCTESNPPLPSVDGESFENLSGTVKRTDNVRTFKLPVLELKKFDGQPMSWITFWGQFKRIHDDNRIDDFDKFRYLIQSTEPYSKARQFIESFPPSGENYIRAFNELKERFARDDLLIETYIRDLLKLVIRQKDDSSLSELYDTLSSHLHALESLGVTTDKYAAMLLPMVESAIPLDILKAWERSRDKSSRPDLNQLLSYIKAEVESEERISAARQGFDQQASTSKQPTATCIVAHPKTREERGFKLECIFCQKGHPSVECSKLSKLTLHEKRELLKEKRACFICFRVGHGAKTCRSFPKCMICSRRHFVAMCPRLEDIRSQKSEEGTPQGNAEALLCLRKPKITFLQTVLVKIVYDGKTVITRALFDSGAQRSYVTGDIANKLGMKASGKETVTHCLFGGFQTKGSHDIYDFKIQNLEGQFSLSIRALCQKKICGILPRLLDKSLIDKLSSLNITINDSRADISEIGLLIGADISGILLLGHIVHIEDSLVAIDTKLGWTLQGQSCNVAVNSSSVAVSCFMNCSLSDLWDLELIGIRDPYEVTSKQKSEYETLKFFRDTVSRDVKGRYVVHLPWKEGFPEMLPVNNKELAYKRLISTTKRLKSTGNLARYNKIFEDWLTEDIIERVEDGNSNSGLYLYHHAVVKESSATTPVRPVFDASAKLQGHSLNSSLEKGTNLLEVIPKLLMVFRKNAIGIIADIRKAFLQISIAENDRNYLKFLWWNDSNECRTLVTYRHKRVVFGVTSSPFLLAATINHHLDSCKDDRKHIAQQLKSSFYVDNCVHSVDTGVECKEFIRVSKELMREAQFDLRGWVYGPCEEESTQSVLGLIWNNKQDSFHIVPEYIDIGEVITKRILLSFAQRIFDPIGYTSPTTIIPKLLLQRCWTLKLDWDDKLPDDIVKEFLVWFHQLEIIRHINIPRRLSDFPVDSNLSIHTFCDASKYAYAACIFLRSEYNGKVQVRLIVSKARVAPVKLMTIPRLELISAVVGVRLYQQAVSALHLSNVQAVFWTDSTVALTWIKRESNWSVFVHNRVKEIHKVTKKSQWFHVAGSMNPADLPSRGCLPEKLKCSNWWMGPEWLYNSSDHWPKSSLGFDDGVATDEVRDIVVLNTEREYFSDRLLHFSKYSKIVRCVGWILRFAHNCKYRNDIRRSNLTYDEYQYSEKVLLKLIQLERYDVTSAAPVSGLDTLILDDGLIHVRSRLLLGDEPETFKYPILVPGNHFIIHRLIYQNHCKLQHAGVTIVISKLRDYYWLTRARRNVKNVISNCSICKRFASRAAQAPVAPLPENRIRTGKVFEVVGIDIAGPLYLKSGDKCWIVLFTCAVFRAVHLELTLSLSTESFLMAFRRFLGRRGRVRVVYSDNGTNFVGASNLFRDLDWDYLQTQLNLDKIEWKFNVPSAPWWGGFWERLIRCLKDLLRRVLGKAALSYVELETVLVDCEATLNSRPLTYISDDDCLTPLTPMHFIHDLPANVVHDLDQIDNKSSNLRHRYIQNLRNDLRERFRKEYLGMLVQRRTSLRKETILKEGDVVLVETDTKRQFWPLGVIVRLIQGVDKVSRTAVIKVNNTTLTRPVQRLYPLELRSPEHYVTRAGRTIRTPERLNV